MESEHPVHILLVDDRLENLLALESILSGMGHHLVKAQSGEAALRSLLKQDFAVILLDVQMPGMDGYETAQLIRSRERSQYTPIIFLTALDSRDANVFKGYSVGAVDFMFKPFVPDVLRFKVGIFVDLFRKTAQIQRHASELEERVQERTADLMVANEALRDEIRERERAEQALRFLTDATAVLASSLDYEDTLQNIVRLAVPRLADLCIVDMMEDEDMPRRVVVSHTNPEVEPEIVQRVQATSPLTWDSPHPFNQALRHGNTQFLPAVTPDVLKSLTAQPDQEELLRSLDIRSAIFLPIMVRGQTIGILNLLYCQSSRRYIETDVPLAVELCRRVSLAVDHAMLFREVQRALSARDQFLSIASHELKTPITTILGYAQLLERRFERIPGFEERNLQALHTLSDQCQRLDRLIRALLDLSRIQTGQFSLDVAPVDLEQLARRIVEETQTSLSMHTLEFSSPGEPIVINADELRLAQVIHNLVQNAIKYSPDGGAITVSLRRDERQVELSVRDEGLGIPASSLPQLFNRFYRASNIDPQVAGMGLGLFVVREIITLHGGTIAVESTVGVGSTFIIRLPYVDDVALPEAAITDNTDLVVS